MIELKNQISINRSREEVFRFIADFENIPLWNYYVKEVRLISSPDGNRKRYHQTRLHDEQIFDIEEFVFPDKLTIQTTGNSKLKFRRNFLFSDVNKDVCRIDDSFDIEIRAPQLVQQIFKTKMSRAVKMNLEKLKELLEIGTVRLQNGKISVR